VALSTAAPCTVRTITPIPRAGRFGDAWPPGEHWPADGVVINQYGGEGEIACCAALFRGLKRRYGHRKVVWAVIVAIIVLALVGGL
jgi:hypothetical protein